MSELRLSASSLGSNNSIITASPLSNHNTQQHVAMQNGFHDSISPKNMKQQFSSSDDNNELNWLDLTLSSMTTSPVATAMLDSNNSQSQDEFQLSSNKCSNQQRLTNGLVDHNFNLDLGAAVSPIAEDFVQPDAVNPQWEWEGFLNTNFST